MKLPGAATRAGTERYRQRFADRLPAEHFSESEDMWISSIGIGTYLGDYDEETDELYRKATVRAVELGCNVIDSAINYRLQRSERAVGNALKELASRGFDRDEIIVATKGGFIPYDGAPPADPRRYMDETFFKPGVIAASDIIAGCHCMTPKYLQHQLDCSLRNLDLECLDIYYLHNPETQLGKVTRSEFNDRLGQAFATLEAAVAAGKIKMYGAATWNGFRNPQNAKDYLSLADVVELAAKCCGRNHHFKVVQLPLNLGMTEALSLTNQQVEGKAMTLLEAAQALGITIMCSASILQGQLTRNLPEVISSTFRGLKTDGQRALQFVRSTPGVVTALVGMKQARHVEENLETASIAPAPWQEYSKLFTASADD